MTLRPEFLNQVEKDLAAVDHALATRYAGDRTGRQPVHTCYVPADKFTSTMSADYGNAALQAITDFIPDPQAFTSNLGIEDHDVVWEKLITKLNTEPVEDVRVDFEDGYGIRASEEEDEHVAQAIPHMSESDVPFIGMRIKCFEPLTRARGLRTLDSIVTGLSGNLPENFIITLPKVTYAEQVTVMAKACTELEMALGLPDHRLGFEVQVETAQAILGPDGAATVAKMIDAGDGRVTAFHYGTYDYSASVGVSAAYQAMDHPAADYAKLVMQVAAAGTGVRLSDGSTNILPVGTKDEVLSAWQLHYSLVRRHLTRAYYQGWDLHPHQLVTRHLATIVFYREGFTAGVNRLINYLGRAETGVADEPATAIALARYVIRGIEAGAVSAEELKTASGLSVEDLNKLLANRGRL